MPRHQVERALTLWATSTITSESINNRLPSHMVNKLDPDDDEETLLSTLFDEMTWSMRATRFYIESCDNIKPDGWVKIKNEAISFAKVNGRRAAIPDNTPTTRVSKNERANLVEDEDSDEEMEEEKPEEKPNNEDPSSLKSSSESSEDDEESSLSLSSSLSSSSPSSKSD